MKAPSALRQFYENAMMSDYNIHGGCLKHKKHSVYIVQLCKDIERLLESGMITDTAGKQLYYVINFDPRANLEAGE